MVRAAIRYGRDAYHDLDMPAGMNFKLARLYFAYTAMKSYIKAGKVNNTVKWAELNPEHWEMVSWVIKRRKHG